LPLRLIGYFAIYYNMPRSQAATESFQPVDNFAVVFVLAGQLPVDNFGFCAA
jgi:hypothetical protein